MLGLAALLCFIGLLIERWMFFANARHVVMRYHGE
jgi:sulfite dehydrogenase (quinone) subunit SoeC